MSRLLAALGHRQSIEALVASPIDQTKGSRVWPDIVSAYGGASSVPIGEVDFASMAKYYCEVIYVHLAISKKARSIAFRPLKFYKRGSDTEIKKHWLIDLFATANPFDCGFMIWEGLSSWRDIAGNSYLAYDNYPGVQTSKYAAESPLRRPGINPKEIYVLRPDRMKVVTDPKGVNYIAGYEYNAPDGKLLYYKPEEVVHFRTFNPRNDFYGLSQVAVGQYAINTEKYAIGQTSKFFENSARPDWYLKTDQPLDDRGADELVRRIESRLRSWWQAYRPTALGRGAEIKPIQWNYKDMDFANLRSMTKRDITNLLDLPLPLIEMVESTFDNAAESRKEYWSNVQMAAREMTEQLSESFLFLREGITCRHDFSDVKALQEDEDKVSQIAVRLTTGMNPLMSVDEARERYYELKPAKWGETPSVPLGVPAGEFLRPEPEPTPPAEGSAEEGEEEPEPRPTKSIVPEANDVYNQLHWFMLVKAWDGQEARWVEELKRLFRQQEREVLGRVMQKSIKKEIDADVFFDYDKWVTAFYQQGLPLESLTISDSLEHAKRYLHDVLGIDVALSLENTIVQQFLRSKTMLMAKEVNLTTRGALTESIRDVLSEGLAAGEAINKIAERVRGVFDTASRSRSILIARTEIVGASNQGALLSYKAAKLEGVVGLKKKWMTALDEKVRDSHKRAGRLAPVSLDAPFVFQGEKGGEVRMNAPGDSGGGPEEVCNCRCVLLPIQPGLT